jgi:hypothetical protein
MYNKTSNQQLGIFAHPIYSQEGDYPSVVKQRVDANSKEEGFTTSRLPKFTSEEINLIKGKLRFSAQITYLIQLPIMSGVCIHTHIYVAYFKNYYTYFYVSGKVRVCPCGTAICNWPTVH